MKITLGIVLYQNSIDEVLTLLNSVKFAKEYVDTKQRDISFQISFFDNGKSPDSFFEELKEKSLLQFTKTESEENLGFGKAHNQLMKEAFSSEDSIYVVVNPDGFFHYRCVDELFNLSELHKHDALIEARQFPKEFSKVYNPISLETPWCVGACLWIPYNVFQITKGFDENIFMYCEDVDISWQTQAAGKKTLFAPDAWFYHDHSQRYFDSETAKKMLLAARYVAYKWSANSFAHKIERRLFKKELIQSVSELTIPPTAKFPSPPKEYLNFSFSQLRW